MLLALESGSRGGSVGTVDIVVDDLHPDPVTGPTLTSRQGIIMYDLKKPIGHYSSPTGEGERHGYCGAVV